LYWRVSRVVPPLATQRRGHSALSRTGEEYDTGMTLKNAGRKFAEEKFRLGVESCPSGMIMINGAGTILVVNVETERLFQYRREELIGQPVEILVPPRYSAELPRYRKAFRDDPNTRPTIQGGEFFGLRKDGTEIPVEIRFNSVRMPDGSLVILGVFNDISERQHSDQMKDEFVAMVSHELRTPLTSIAASLGLLVADPAGTLSEPAKRLLRIAHSNSQRLVRLINDILDMEKIESGKIEFHMSRINVLPLLGQVIESNRGLADQFEVTLRLDPESTNAVVRADIDRLTQVVTNLLANAVKFSPRGGEVSVSIEGIGTRVRIGVRDHGTGIPEEFKSRIFERFAQADSSDTHQKGGTGLGLNIVKQIVGRLGGQTGFDAAPGGGTIFYVDLPQYDAESMAAFDRVDGAQILLCADDAVAAALLCEQLHQARFNVDVAFTAEEAVRGSASRSYAAIVVDLQLPDSDGITLIKQLRSQWYYQNTPVVAVSADSKHFQSDERGSTFNALDWLRKPLDIERLTRILNRPIIRDEHPRPRILHFDGDRDVLRLVADALKASAEVFSADTIDMARHALAEHVFDHAVVEVNLAGGEFGIDLLADLRDKNGHPIPAIMYSDSDRPEIAAGVIAALAKSPTSIQALVAILRRLVAGRLVRAPKIKEVA
jgi:PAS domain S-box-containing protein